MLEDTSEFSGDSRTLLGKFFTVANPFRFSPFFEWFEKIPEEKKRVLLEPFAGSNNIVRMIQSLGISSSWMCFDIEPGEENAAPEFPVAQRDTLADFPSGFFTAITNPPYLARNSASRKHLPFPDSPYNDLYKISLDVMLQNLDYVAAIVPESFLTSGLFQERLYAVISLTCRMFEDTECPVCLAMFVPEKTNDFQVYAQNHFLGTYAEMISYVPEPKESVEWRFNDVKGSTGIRCTDTQTGESIRFVPGEEIDPEKIKVSSRSLTRVSGLPEDIPRDDFFGGMQ